MALDKELNTYRTMLPTWVEHEGKFVLIKGEEVIDFFQTYEDAIKGGYQRFGLEPFLVQRVQTTEQVQYITRLMSPALATR